MRPLLWRLHFLGGFLVAPIVVWLAVSGIAYAWNPQIEAALYGEALTASPDAQGAARSLSAQVAAAQGAHPGWEVHSVTPAAGDEQPTTGVMLRPPAPDAGGHHGGFGPPEGAVTVYVDPGSAEVTGEIAEAERPDEWLRSLHSSWRLGPVAEPLTELAASWAVVSLLTGVYLWWPRGRVALRRSFRFRRPGRVRWRSVHTLLGMGLLVPLLVMIGTGLTWTNYAGAWVDVARAQLRSEAPAVSTDLATSAGTGGAESHAGHTRGDHDHGGAAAPAPDPAATIDRVVATARDAGLDGVLEVQPAHEPGHAWTASVQKRQWPIEEATVAIDPASGRVTDRVDWSDYPLLAKATTTGIAFHEAKLFGLANQVGLTVLALALIVLVAAGYRMWSLRRPAGGLGALPPVGRLLRTTPVPVLLALVLLMVLLPTLGVALLLVLGVERAVRVVRPRARRRR